MLEKLIKAEQAFSKVLLSGCVVLVVVASLARWFGHPIIWSVDMAQLLFIWVCFFGANQALRRGEHIGVDFFILRLPKGLQKAISVVFSLTIIAFLLYLVKLGYDLTAMNVERRFSDTDMSYAWVTAAVPVGCAMLAVTSVVNLIKTLRDEPIAQELPPEEVL
ncbi:TRAP transporter small permease [Rhodobacteraceae bacterium RKSG542]|uniref:TRAP transporter small permease n=1 Tax=Pseudovibrio flavus TaxID=2529854 RepID=UPI0012BD1A70|nr:TRAP transporter small permease [Pseudovibrio flavus]MTI18191.1 TRAP transporter small permease [Pseudovibrio flavus]